MIQAKTNYVKRNLGVDPATSTIMREGMREAVADGSAPTDDRASSSRRQDRYAEFGEQRPDGSYQEHGWFTGFAPFENPQIAVGVFLETGGGALSAAPVASKIVSYYFQRKNSAQGATTTP